jgi:hypothetical protein
MCIRSFADETDFSNMGKAEVIDAAKIMALVTLNTYDEAIRAGFLLPRPEDYKAYQRQELSATELGQDLALAKIENYHFCKNFDPELGHILYGRGDILNLYFAAYIIKKYQGIPFYKPYKKHQPIDVRSGVGRWVDNTGGAGGSTTLRPFGEVTPYNSFMSPSDAAKRQLAFSVTAPNPGQLPGNYTVNIATVTPNSPIYLDNDTFHLNYYNGLASHPKFNPFSMQGQVLDQDFLAKLRREGGTDRNRQINWLAIRRASKYGVSFFSSNAVLFYVLDGLDLAAIANKQVIQNKIPICTSELRYIFRNWHYFKARATLVFLRKFELCRAPWEENPAQWAPYADALIRKYQEVNRRTGSDFAGVQKLWVDFFFIEIAKQRWDGALRYFSMITPVGRTYTP